MTNDNSDHATPPRFLLIQMNQTCNLRCQHCHLWRNTDPAKLTEKYASLHTSVVREFAEINPHGIVIIGTGEPLMEKEHFFNLCEVARKSGLVSATVTNGTLVTNQDQADELLALGTDEITLSLDSPIKKIHDQLRGMRGAYERTTECVKILVNTRQRLRLPRRINVNLLVCDYNYQQLDVACDLVLRQLGADKIKLVFLLPTISLSTQKDSFWNLHSRHIDTDDLIRVIDECDAKYGLSLEHLSRKNIRDYTKALSEYHHGNPLLTSRNSCNAHEQSLIVEITGLMSMCLSNKFPKIQYRSPGDLHRYWYSPETEETRSKMRECREICSTCDVYQKTTTIGEPIQ